MDNLVLGKFYKLNALAKINLRLKVVGRLANGHHLLQMLNILTSLADRLEIAIIDKPEVTLQIAGSEVGGLPETSADNIIHKTINSFFSALSLNYGACVKLEKEIPIGAGLGGGSSDAATVLAFLVEHFKSEVETQKLDVFTLAKEIGADVPYLLEGGLALVEGIGEKITPLIFKPEVMQREFFADLPAALLIPTERIITAQAFRLYRESHPTIELDQGEFLSQEKCVFLNDLSDNQAKRSQVYQQFLALCENDLSLAATLISPQVQQTLAMFADDLELKVCLTGSGSAMFVLPRDPDLNLENILANKIKEKNLEFLKIIPIKLLAYFKK